MLSSIYEWSIEHIKNVFEAKSEDECLRALDETFSQNIDFTTNGKQLTHADLRRFVLTMVTTSGFRLKVQWHNAVEVPRDGTNRVRSICSILCASCALPSILQDGVLGGYYTISNIRKVSLNGAPVPGRFERHKFVNVV